MSKTVDELRDEIREAAGRFERVEPAAFTKEDLAAVCEAVGHDIDTAGRLPAKSRMRAGILRAVGEPDGDGPDGIERPLRKAELRSVAAALRDE